MLPPPESLPVLNLIAKYATALSHIRSYVPALDGFAIGVALDDFAELRNLPLDGNNGTIGGSEGERWAWGTPSSAATELLG